MSQFTQQWYAEYCRTKGIKQDNELAEKLKKADSQNLEIHVTMTDSKDVSKLNRTERAFYDYLQAFKPQWLGVQGVTLKIGDDCRYTPDFVCLHAEQTKLIAYEVKGFMRDDALVKLKVAARQYRWIEFVVVKKIKNSWELKTVNH